MTGKIIFTTGVPREVEFEEKFEDPHRLINGNGVIMVAKDYPNGNKFRREPHLLLYIRNVGQANGRKAIIADETVSGASVNLPYVESISHWQSKER